MGADAPNLELHDWLILDALSDDYESVEQIVDLVKNVWPAVTAIEIINRLERLYTAGHVVLTLGAEFDLAEMIREIDQTRDRRFWFGRSPSGDTLWQQYSADL